MEPDFCPKMIDHFRDKEWISCDGIAHAIRRAFQSWAANHQMISFTNVSATCRADASVQECEQRNAVTCASLSGTARIECYRQRGNCTKLCGAAEVVLLAEASTGARLIDSVALVQHWDSLGATAADSVAVVSRGPRLTNGILSARDALIKKATVTYLRGPVCYYPTPPFARRSTARSASLDRCAIRRSQRRRKEAAAASSLDGRPTSRIAHAARAQSSSPLILLPARPAYCAACGRQVLV
eukprot:6536213-Prymnesium_polylepis.1